MPNWDCISLQRCAITGVFNRLDQDQREKLLDGAEGRRTALHSAVKGYKREMMRDPNLPSTSTIKRWIKHYLFYGETPAESKRLNRKRKRSSDWDDSDSEYSDTSNLREIVTEHPYLFLDEIQMRLFYKTHKWFSVKTVYYHMKDIGFSLKVAYEVASQRDEEERADWRLWLLELGPDIGEKLIFIDETHKGVKEMRSRRHWVIKGKQQPFYRAKFFGGKDFRYSMIGVADINGFVLEAIEVVPASGPGDDVGPIDRDRFVQFIQEKLLPVLGRFEYGEPRSLVVLDNASIHISKEIVDLIESTGAKIVYLPPYSPDCNPIELMFSSYKKKMKRIGIKLGYGWYTAHLVALLESVTPRQARNLFRHCHIPVNPMCEDDQTEQKKRKKLIVIAACVVALVVSNII
jgi:transposase